MVAHQEDDVAVRYCLAGVRVGHVAVYFRHSVVDYSLGDEGRPKCTSDQADDDFPREDCLGQESLAHHQGDDEGYDAQDGHPKVLCEAARYPARDADATSHSEYAADDYEFDEPS